MLGSIVALESIDIKVYVFWTNIISMHQSAFIRALASIEGITVIYAFEEDISSERLNSGWYIPDFGQARIVDVREANAFNELCSLTSAEVCHCFGGAFYLPHAGRAIRQLRAGECRKVWITEGFDLRGFMGFFRRCRLRWWSLFEADRFDKILAMGVTGVECFRKNGFSLSKIGEFGYLTENLRTPLTFELAEKESSELVRLIFVGQLVPRKSVDTLLRSLERLREFCWHLTVVGGGRERGKLEALALAANISSRVSFVGVWPNGRAIRAIQDSDCLILPSLFDGWGSVANEALLVGTNIIVSDRCGSAALINPAQDGLAFRAGDWRSLRDALLVILRRGPVSSTDRRLRAMRNAQTLDPLALAIYFEAAIHSERSVVAPPWRGIEGGHESRN